MGVYDSHFSFLHLQCLFLATVRDILYDESGKVESDSLPRLRLVGIIFLNRDLLFSIDILTYITLN